ncbi:MAG: ATP-binding protein [Thiohalocapsa sp.]
MLLIVVLGLAAWAGAAAAPPVIAVTDDTTLPLQVERMELLRDPTQQLDLARVRAPDIAAGFKPAAADIPNLGVGRDAVWARFAVRNATDAPLSLLLTLADARIAHVAFWALDSSGQVLAQRRDGRFADPGERDRSHRWFLFDLPLAADATATVFLRVVSDTGRRLDLRLTDHTHLAAADRAAFGWLGLFFGALLFMLAYNLLLLLQLRDPAYLWLCCVIAGGIIWVAAREGLLTTLLWRVWPDGLSGIDIGPALAFIGIFLFPVAYLRMAQRTPRLARVHSALAIFALSLPVLSIWAPQASYALISALAAICAPVSVVAGLLLIRGQTRAAAWYLASWLPMFVAMLLLPPMNYGLLPAWTPIWGLTYVGLLFMLLLLSVAQADRVNELRRHAERAQAALLRNEQRLTELVDERTRELATARDRAEAASRAKTQFLANMSHELRTPLNAMLGGVDLLRRSPGLGPEEQQQCGLIQRGGHHLLRLIDDLLDIARIEHGRLRPVLGTLALRPMLDDLAAVTHRHAEARGLGFRADFAPDLPELIRTDGRRLRQVLHNLLDNAVKYTDTGSVRFEADLDPVTPVSADGDTLTLLFSVTDTGCGIAEADRERLFAPFEQFHHTQVGSGLGLAICRELASVLGGALSLDSTPGQGSCFRLRLPVGLVAGAPAEVGNDAKQAPIVGYEGPRRRILIVDDSHVNQLVMAGLLGHLGFEAKTAGNADAALAIARREPPDLAIVDLRMPEVCGYAASCQLREGIKQPGLPVIAASASPLPEPSDVAELGFDAFVLKPVEQEALCAAIGECLDLRWVRGRPGGG